jgi:hypothetical protein
MVEALDQEGYTVLVVSSVDASVILVNSMDSWMIEDSSYFAKTAFFFSLLCRGLRSSFTICWWK